MGDGPSHMLWEDALEDVCEDACEDAGEMGTPQQPDSAYALVAVVNHPRDWQCVLEGHWYRIPLDRAPSRIAVQYIAFYHTRSFPELRWTVRYYAPVERFDVVTRRELLPAEPGHPRADASYFKISLGPLWELPRPIPSRRLRRVTFILTTLPRLFRAQEINDLWMREDAQAPLRRALTLREAVPQFMPV